MRLLIALAACAALTVSAFAQDPKEIDTTNTIKIYPGESRIIRFDQGVKDIKFSDGIVQVSIESDQTFVLRGLRPGSAIMSAFDPSGTVVHRARIVVPGTLVRIYGTGTVDEKKSDYAGYICTDIGCGRADPDVDRSTLNTVERTRTNSRGHIITTTTRN
jgi:hypothetical protein